MKSIFITLHLSPLRRVASPSQCRSLRTVECAYTTTHIHEEAVVGPMIPGSMRPQNNRDSHF